MQANVDAIEESESIDRKSQLFARFSKFYQESLEDFTSHLPESYEKYAIEEAVQSFLIDFLFTTINHDKFKKLGGVFKALAELNRPEPEIAEILENTLDQQKILLNRYNGAIFSPFLLNFEDLAQLASISPSQGDLGAFFTPSKLAKQITQECIINWIYAQFPKDLQRTFSFNKGKSEILENYISGPDVRKFLDELKLNCQFFAEKSPQNQVHLQTVFQKTLDCQISDPACGSGVFLSAAAECLFVILRDLRPSVAKSCADHDIARNICTRTLFGSDLKSNFVRVARMVALLTMEPYLRPNDLQDCYQSLCDHIREENFLLSPLRNYILPVVPLTLVNNILEEIATCFLDIASNVVAPSDSRFRVVLDQVKGPINAIPDASWQYIGKFLGMPRTTNNGLSLVTKILVKIIPPSNNFIHPSIILGNPPYEGARKEPGRQGIQSWVIRIQRQCIKFLQKQGFFGDLQKAWDFSLPFVAQAFEMLDMGGIFSLILPRAVGTQSFSEKLFKRYAKELLRVVYFQSQKKALFEGWDNRQNHLVEIGNKFLVLICSKAKRDEGKVIIDEIETSNFSELPSSRESRTQNLIQKFFIRPPQSYDLPGIPLGTLVTITKGATLCAKAEWRRLRGAFKIRDLVVPKRDENHSLRLVEPTQIIPYGLLGENFLEYQHRDYPDRVPKNIHRWREDSFFHGPQIVTPLSARRPLFAIIDEETKLDAWRAPETVVLIKRWTDWYVEFPKDLPLVITKMERKSTLLFRQWKNLNHNMTPQESRQVLQVLSAQFSLKALIMILSSPIVHALRLKNAKSFGKFETGDWDRINIPLLESKEIKFLEQAYDNIQKIIVQFRIAAIKSVEDIENLEIRSKHIRELSCCIEKYIFSKTTKDFALLETLVIQKDLDVVVEILNSCSKLVERAYTRSKEEKLVENK